MTAWLWLGYGAFIVYGSLLPFDFQPHPLAQAQSAFRDLPLLRLDVYARADWIANGVLYAPFGVLTAWRFGAGRRGVGRAFALGAAAVLCAALAVAVEFAQLFFPPRTVSQNDLLAEGLGSAVGIAVAPLLEPWANRLRAAWSTDARRVVHHLLQAYAVGYLLFCFFPYDLLLSPQELADKARSDAWGWLVATPQGWSAVRAMLHAAAEVVLTMPFGWLLVVELAAPRRRVVSLPRAAAYGAALGLVIEAGQFLVATGTSQGLSVLTRSLAVGLGAGVGRVAARVGVDTLRDALARATPWLAAGCAGLLTLAAGWWARPWHGLDGAAESWRSLRLMPFYYHYFTSEAVALTSLAGNFAAYLPLTALCWARRVRPLGAAALAFAAAAAVETGKLFVPGTHPDPTNLLIAAAAGGLPLALARIGGRPSARGGTAEPPASTAVAATGRPPGSAWPLLALPPVAIWLLLLPLPSPGWRLLTGTVIAAGAALVAWRPQWLPAVVAAALPVWDLAPWTGRFFWDEFDLLLAACLAVAWCRTPVPMPSRRRRRLAPAIVFAATGIALAVSAVRGLLAVHGIDDNSFSSYYSGFNALRVAKGAVWAGLFVLVWRRLPQRPPAHDADGGWFGVGMRIGLALSVAVIVWERTRFAGLFDFAADYRVTGPFSAMHKGGAYVECYLAVASAYLVSLLVDAPRRGHTPAAAAAVALLAATAYAQMVTFSRNGYASFAWVIVAGAVAGVARRRGASRSGWRAAVWPLAGVAAAGLVAVAVLGGTFARERLSTIRHDLQVRAAHWADALAMRDADAATRLFGVGLGRFPETHFWRSRETVRAAGFRIERDATDGNRFLRLGAGAPIYIEQVVDLPADSGTMTVTARLRTAAASGGASVAVTLCRKWLLTSRDCQDAVLRAPPGGTGWQMAQTTLPPRAPSPVVDLPLKLSLTTPAAGVVDVDDVRLLTAGGVDRVANGDFAAGLDRWFFSTDVDPPWHVHSLPVHVLFEQGWFGVAAWAALLAAALTGGARAAWAGSPAALPAFVGLLALLVSGTLNTLIDAPRFLFLLLLLAWLCIDADAKPPRPVRPAD